VIVDSGNCINAISSKSLEYLGSEVVPHLIHSKCHGLTSRHLRSNNDVLSQSISTITKTIWCDVITMNVSRVIFGRPWFFDKNVTIYGRFNMCQFGHEDKQIKLLFLRPKTGQPKQTYTLALLPTAPSQSFIATASLLHLTSHAYPSHKLCFLLYCRHHYTIEHSSLHPHLHLIKTCTHFTKI